MPRLAIVGRLMGDTGKVNIPSSLMVGTCTISIAKLISSATYTPHGSNYREWESSDLEVWKICFQICRMTAIDRKLLMHDLLLPYTTIDNVRAR